MKIESIIEGMQIVAKYTKDKFCVQGEHDQIFCGSFDLPLTEDEKARMLELGWFEEYDSWSCWT